MNFHVKSIAVHLKGWFLQISFLKSQLKLGIIKRKKGRPDFFWTLILALP